MTIRIDEGELERNEVHMGGNEVTQTRVRNELETA